VDRDRLNALAELAVKVGANVAEGQYVMVVALVEHAPLVREITKVAYEAGARYVDVAYIDQHVRRAMIEKGPDDVLEWSPPWSVDRVDYLGAEQGALISITGDPEPELLSDLDQARVGKTRAVKVAEAHLRNVMESRVNWTIVSYPNEGWAQTVFGEPDVDRLWQDVERAVRLDEPDPVVAWNEHIERLEARCRALNDRHFDAVRFHGLGTDLTVGLNKQSKWASGGSETVFGRRHVPNIPTEEVFTTPDWRRAEGTVRSTMPLALPGNIIRDLELRFAGGRVVDVKASTGADYVRAQLEADEGAARLGEVALVDGSSRVGQIGHIFFNTLFDENATCHIAYGRGIAYCVDGSTELDEEAQLQAGVNQSSIHTDFMIGGPEVSVDGVTESGESVPLIRDNEFQLT
jgi:aminopeptidase